MNEEDLTGKIIQGYFVQKPIGQGKFATVYKAETEDKRIVALKKIRIFEMNDPRLRDKCLKEVRLMQQLEHPNIIKYLDSFIVNNELIIITEWAEKGDLKKVLKTAITAEVPIEEPKIWEYMNQIALALKHMHDKRIMHRDLKPANIFLSNEDILKVGDFGLGRVFSEETVEAYSKVGTPLYMSPELLVGQGYDMKSDVWSLGCIVYEMCEQKSPFRNDNEKMSLMDLFNNITKGEYKPVSHRFSEELRTTIHDMIVVDPQKRCDTNRVIEACQNWREKQKHSLKIDCLIVMEDVLEKLNLLEYRKNFCIPRNLKPISKTYFAISESAVDKQEKFKYFIQLAYWLIGLIQEVRKQGGKAPVIGKPKLDDDPKVVSKKLLDDLTSIDTPFNKQITPESLSQGTDEAVCYVLNELINKRLILTNFQFIQPKFNNADADDEELAEDYGIRELDPAKVFTNDQKGLPTESDDDEDKGNLQTINTTYHSNSTSATSTYTDQMYKFTKRPTPGGGLDDEMIINEDGMMELDSVEWNKEVDRVTKELDDLTQKLDGGDAISVIQTSDERVYHLEGLKKYNTNIKSHLHNIGKHPWQKKIQDWNDTIQSIRKGEKVLNDTTAQLTDDFKNLVSEKGNIYQQLQTQTKLMKDKVEILEQTTQKLKNIREVISEKEKLMFGADRKIEIQKGIQNLKVELKQMDVKAEIMKGLLLRYAIEGREKVRERKASFDEVEGI